jgi:hypothetical protein
LLTKQSNMHTTLTPEIREILEAIHYRPAVSIILPFQPKISLKTELNHALKLALDKVGKELNENYLEEMNKLVMQKLKNIINNLNFNTHKQSIAIYVSPVFEKVLYLDIPVEEKIIVDESFEIRDIIYNKKQQQKYLLLLLSSKESKVYLGDIDKLDRIASNTPESVYAYVNEAPEKVANFSDMSARKEIVMEKFLRNIDRSLDIILKTYNVPIFVLGTEKIIGYFKKTTKHGSSINDFVFGNYEEKTVNELKKLIQPKIDDWQKIKDINVLNKLKTAVEKKQISFGIKSVWKDAMSHKGKLLVVEKNYKYAAEHSLSNEATSKIFQVTEPYNKFSYIKDAVDDIIEKVLENGGDVEFVETGSLNEYNHIALIHYY